MVSRYTGYIETSLLIIGWFYALLLFVVVIGVICSSCHLNTFTCSATSYIQVEHVSSFDMINSYRLSAYRLLRSEIEPILVNRFPESLTGSFRNELGS